MPWEWVILGIQDAFLVIDLILAEFALYRLERLNTIRFHMRKHLREHSGDLNTSDKDKEM
jgi:hypothetical protein